MYVYIYIYMLYIYIYMLYIYIYVIYIYICIYIHIHVFCSAQDSSVWLGLTSICAFFFENLKKYEIHDETFKM